MELRSLIKRIIYGYRYNSDTYISHLRKKGVKIGKNVYFYSPIKTIIDEQYPWMISIGNDVRITSGVTILTHDYSWCVLKKSPNPMINGAVIGASGKVTIGDNVFIGMNATILRNVTIGNNVIIGCSSVVVDDCEENFVYAGNPARKICLIDDFYNKRKDNMLHEAKTLAIEYKKSFGKLPPKDVLREYFMLFENGSTVKQNSEFLNVLSLMGNYEDSLNYITNNTPQFNGYDEFLNYCFSREEIYENKN